MLKNNNIIRDPNPYPNPILFKVLKKVGKKILDVGKKVVNFLFGDDVKDEEPLDLEKNGTNDIFRLNEILMNHRKLVKSEMEPVENDVINYCKEVFDSIIESLEFANEQVLIYRTDRIKRKTNNFLESLHGIFEIYTTKRISLDDEECVNILKMMPGEPKSQKMADLKKKVFKESVDEINKRLLEFSNDFFEDIETSVNTRLEGLEEKLNEKTDIFGKIANSNNEQNEEFEKITLKSSYISSLSEYVLLFLD